MRGFLGRCALAASGALIGFGLSIFPLVADAQEGATPAAMVEPAPSDFNSWGFAAVVPVGGTITWTNMGSQKHTVTAADGSFDSGLIDVGGTATIEFDTPGTYAYLCSPHPHPWMKGYIYVSPDAPSASTMAIVEGSATDIQSWGFAVSVPVGQTVAWTNTGAQGHSVTSPGGAFDTGLVAPGSTAPVTFGTAGLFAYVCTPHPWMKGAVVVS